MATAANVACPLVFFTFKPCSMHYPTHHVYIANRVTGLYEAVYTYIIKAVERRQKRTGQDSTVQYSTVQYCIPLLIRTKGSSPTIMLQCRARCVLEMTRRAAGGRKGTV